MAGFGERGRDVPREPHVFGEEEKGQGELLVRARGVHSGDPELQGGGDGGGHGVHNWFTRSFFRG